jgi:hypothetical protein
MTNAMSRCGAPVIDMIFRRVASSAQRIRALREFLERLGDGASMLDQLRALLKRLRPESQDWRGGPSRMPTTYAALSGDGVFPESLPRLAEKIPPTGYAEGGRDVAKL